MVQDVRWMGNDSAGRWRRAGGQRWGRGRCWRWGRRENNSDLVLCQAQRCQRATEVSPLQREMGRERGQSALFER
eukprot:2823205-Pyramimonas_sp.AAC.1